MINLLELNYKDEILITEELNYPISYLRDTDILKLDNVFVKGSINKEIEGYGLKVQVKGKMLLHDSVTYEEIFYPFTVEIEENLENSVKELDLMEFLWHYIVLEIPIRYTVSSIDDLPCKDIDIISEEEYNKKNNPFKDFFVE